MAKKMLKRPNPRYTYQPGNINGTKFQLSRTGIEEYLDCKKCFYLYRKLGLKRPSMIPFNLNLAVDNLFKNEFDFHRKQKTPHPIMQTYGVNAIPYSHPELNLWRENFKGVRVDLIGTDMEIFGAVDDLWVYEDGSVIVADYKATSKSIDDIFAPIRSWNDVWNSGQSYKRQLEIYQWLLFHKGLTVSQDCFLIYANAHKDKQEFNNVLDFEVTLLKHQGDFSWVDGVLMEIYSLLNQNIVPEPNQDCEMCGFVESSNLLLS